MNNFDVELTWKDIFYEDFPHLKKDKTFTSRDLIRFYEKNLDWIEKEEIEDYFCEMCEEKLPDPIPPEAPLSPPLFPPLLPPVIIVLPAPPPIQLPAPPPQIIEPIYKPFLLPVWPFIIPGALPPDILDYLLDALGVNELHAKILDLESELYLKKEQIKAGTSKGYMDRPEKKYVALMSQNVTLMSQNEALMSQNVTLMSQNEALTARINLLEHEIFWSGGDEPAHEDTVEEEEEEKEEYIPSADEGLPGDVEKINFYNILSLLEIEAERLGIDIFWRYWVVDKGITWYMFNIDGNDFEWTIDELLLLLQELKEVPTPDQMEI